MAGDYRYESKSGMAPPAAPAIRKIARELDIDLTRVRGSEAGGRINLADLKAYVQKLQQLAFEGAAARRLRSPRRRRPRQLQRKRSISPSGARSAARKCRRCGAR